MFTLRVDSSFIPGVIAPITVDALLSAVEPVLAQCGRIVTALRINGVDAPAFRERDILTRALADVDEVDLATTPVSQMAMEALDAALRFLPEVADSARGIAHDLRQRPGTDPGVAIGGLAENLALLAALVHTADLWARQSGLAATDWVGEDVVAIERVAGALQGACASADWMTAASSLDSDLPEALSAWHRRLTAGRAALEAIEPLPAV